MIRRYDEVISDKASKTAIKEIYEVMRHFVKIPTLKEVQAATAKDFEDVR